MAPEPGPPSYAGGLHAGGDILYAEGDQNVFGLVDRGFWLRPLDVSPGPADEGEPSSRRLLHPQFRAVTFVGRSAELAEARRWCDSDAPLGVLLLVGPGGQGKSRLALELAAGLAADGWTVEEASLTPGAARAHAVDPGVTEGRLVVADYADRWPPETLRSLLRLIRTRRGSDRLVLIARSSGWWSGLRRSLDELDLDEADTPILELPSGAPTSEARTRHYEESVRGFARALGVDGRPPPPPELLSEPFDQILSVHMLALASVLALQDGRPAPTTPLGVSEYLIGREVRHWTELEANQPDHTTTARTMRRTVATATLAGPRERAASVALLQSVGLAESRAAASAIADDHALCYPPATERLRLQPLLPDRLGEDLVGLMLSGLHGAADGWLGDELPTITQLPTSGERRPTTILIETAARWHDVLTTDLVPLLAAPAVVDSLSSGELARLADLSAYPQDALGELLDRAKGRAGDRAEGLAVLAGRVLRDRVAQERSRSRKAELLAELSDLQRQAGMCPEAETSIRESLRLGPDGADLESVLTRVGRLGALGMVLTDARQHDEALAASMEAGELLSTVTMTGPVAVPVVVAHLHCLNNVAVDLRNTGRSGLSALERAEELNQQLTSGGVDPGLHLRASIAKNLAQELKHADRDRALANGRHAVVLFRELAPDNPGRGPLDLAMALIDVSAVHVWFGEDDEAIDLLTEAEQVLAAPGLSPWTTVTSYRALCACGIGQTGIRSAHDPHAAVTDVERGCDLYEQLLARDPIGFLGQAMAAYGSLAACHEACGDPVRALAAADRSIELLDRMVELGLYVDATEAAIALHNRASIGSLLGRSAQGVQDGERAVALLEPVVAAAPDLWSTQFALLLAGLADDLVTEGKLANAEDRARRAEETLDRHLDGAVYTPTVWADRARAYSTTATTLGAVGDHAGSARCLERTVALRRELWQRGAVGAGETLLRALAALSEGCRAVADDRRRTEVLTEAAALVGVVERDGHGDPHQIVEVLSLHADDLHRRGLIPAATEAATAARRRCLELDRDAGSAHGPTANLMALVGRVLGGLGDIVGALDSLDRAWRRHDSLAAPDSDLLIAIAAADYQVSYAAYLRRGPRAAETLLARVRERCRAAAEAGHPGALDLFRAAAAASAQIRLQGGR